MCLDKLADFEVKKDYGLQCFVVTRDEIRQRYIHHNIAYRPVKVDEWQKDRERGRIGNFHSRYQTGYHISLSKKGIEQHECGGVTLRVYFRNIVATGYQTGGWDKGRYKTIVARERYVCDKTKRPPKD